MSRNSDKASSLANNETEAGDGGYKDYSRFKRPRNVGRVKSAKEAQEWRNQLVQEFKQLSVRMYDPALTEGQLEEGNERLNELLREKGKWDKHVAYLAKNKGKQGGSAERVLLAGAKKVLGKWYFGRATELPEVSAYIADQKRKELLARVAYTVDVKSVPSARDESERAQLYYAKNKDNRLARSQEHWTHILQGNAQEHRASASQTADAKPADKSAVDQHPVPTQQQMEQFLVHRRKQDLLAKLDV